MMTQVVEKEVLVIGGGPAGLKFAYEAQQKGLDYLVLEKDQVGAAWRKMKPDMKMLSPDHPQRDWTSLTYKFPIWKMDVQRPYCTAGEFVRYLDAFVDHFQLTVQTQTAVEQLEKRGTLFTVRDRAGNLYQAPYVVVATGIFGNPYLPPLPGINDNPLVIHSHAYLSHKPYKQKRVMVFGAGNSAAEIAIDLAGYAQVYLVTRGELKFFLQTHQLYHIRGAYESYLKELIEMEMIRHLPHRDLQAIEGNRALLPGEEYEMDAFIFATGYRGDLRLVNNFTIKTNRKNFPAVKASGESEQVDNLYFAGPLAFQSAASIVVHGFLRQIPKTVADIMRKLSSRLA